LPGIDLLQVAAGPAAAGADCGLLRIAAGTRFPWHAHVGEETTLVLRGGAVLSSGQRMAPGDELVAVAGDEHDFVVDDDGACVLAVRARGVRFKRRPAGRDADPAGAD
ncbi:MAG: cupin domain-containing protein, partial [Myxococcales bacterium]|nr:cupin domain-containing protein [Myxococcales bacterium]